MKKFLPLLIIALLFLGTTTKAQSPEMVSYYYKGKKVYYPVSYDRIIAEIKPGYSFDKMKKDISKIMAASDTLIEPSELSKQFLVKRIEKDNKKSWAAVSALKNLPGILFTRPVCKGDGGKYWSYGKEFIVKLKPGAAFSDLQILINKNACTLVKKYPFGDGIFILAAGESAGYDGLAMANLFYETGLFEYAEPDTKSYDIFLSEPNDSYYNKQWALNNTGSNYPILGIAGTPGADMNILKAWGITKGDPNIIVGVIDEGVDLTHPDLQANLLQGYNAITNSALPGDGAPIIPSNAHGTGCAGIIAAVADNNIGITGVAPNCKIIPATIFADELSGTGGASVSGIAAAIDYVWAHDAAIISNSWVWQNVSNSIDDAINRAVTLGRSGKGCMVFFATGNNDLAPVSYPSSNPQVISVGGVNMCNQRKSPSSAACDQESWGANYGDGLDVVAPCVKIVTTDNQGINGSNHNTSEDGGDYRENFNGTSSACPNAAGVAALLLSYDNTLTREKAEAILKYSCDRVGDYTYADQADDNNGPWNFEMGYGRVNAFKAIQLASFKITYPNGSEHFSFGTSELITWDTGFTNRPALLNVKIFLSTDGGLTFPTVLENNTANDGMASVIIPAINTNTARIKIETTDGAFYVVSNSNFAISAPKIWFKADAPILPAGTVNSTVTGVDTLMLDLDPSETGIDTTVTSWFSDGAFKVGGNQYKLTNSTGNKYLNPPLFKDENDSKLTVGFGGIPSGQVLSGDANKAPFQPGSARTIMVVGKIACNAPKSSPLLTFEDDGSGTTHTNTKFSLGIFKQNNKTFAYTGSSLVTTNGVAGTGVFDTAYIDNQNFEYGMFRYLAIYEIDENGNSLKFRLNKADVITSSLNGLQVDINANLHSFKIEKGLGSINEIIAFDGKLNTADRNQWEDYLYTKYNIKPSRPLMPSVPVIEVTGGTTTGNNTEICYGDSVKVNITGELNGAKDWVFRKDFCGNGYIGYGDGQVFGEGAAGFGYTGFIKPAVTTTYFVRGEGECDLKGDCASFTITVKTSPDPKPEVFGNYIALCVGQRDSLWVANQHSDGAKWKWYTNTCCTAPSTFIGEGDTIVIFGAASAENNKYFVRSEGPGCLVGPAYNLPPLPVLEQKTYIKDADADGWSIGDPVSLCTNEVPTGYFETATYYGQAGDCDDDNSEIHGVCSSSTLFANVSASYACPGKATMLASAGYTDPLENPSPVYNYSFQQPGPGSTWIVIYNGNLNYFTINLPASTLTYRVVVSDNLGNSRTKTIAINPAITAPPSFTLIAAGCSDQGILISPNTPDLLPPYDYFYQDAETWVQFAHGGTEPVAFSPANQGASYTYNIRAVNACGQEGITSFNFLPRIYSMYISSASFNNCNAGALNLAGQGIGSLSYSLRYQGPSDTLDGTVPPVFNYDTIPFQSSPSFTGLTPSTYLGFIKDGCDRVNNAPLFVFDQVGPGYPQVTYFGSFNQIPITVSPENPCLSRVTVASPPGLNNASPTGVYPRQYGVQMNPGEHMRWQDSDVFDLPNGTYYFAIKDACDRVSNWERYIVAIPHAIITSNSSFEDDECGAKITLVAYNPDNTTFSYCLQKIGSSDPADLIIQSSNVFHNVPVGTWKAYTKDDCGYTYTSSWGDYIIAGPSVSIAVSPGFIVAPGQAVTFTATVINGGTTPTFQWQKNGIDIPGATSNIYIENNPSTASYSCNVTSFATCGQGVSQVSNSSNSIVLTVIQGLAVPCSPYIGPYNYNFFCIGQVQLGAINHYSGCEDGHYTFFSTTTANLTAGSAQTINLRSGSYTGGVIHCSVFIDYNRDGDFDDANELVVNNETVAYDNSVAFPFTIPADASIGNCSMRVMSEPIDACTTYSGEVEDYVLNIQPAGTNCTPFVDNNPCEGGDYFINSVILGDISNNSGCNNGYADFSATQSTDAVAGGTVNYSVTSGSQYNYGKMSIYIDYDKNGIFSEEERVITNADFYYNQPLTGSLAIPQDIAVGDYRLRVVEEFGYQALTDACHIIAGEAEDYTLSVKPFIYCHTVDNPCSYFAINNVSIGNIANSSGCGPSGNGYNNYSKLFTINASAGETLDFTLTTGPGPSTGIANIFIDYNNDGDFDDLGERVVNSLYLYGSYYNTNLFGYNYGTFALPAGLAAGKYRFRVITGMYDGNIDIDPCHTSTGEIEDYTLNVVGSSVVYCIPASTGQCAVSIITNVNVGSINNSSTCSNSVTTPGYSDYSASQKTNVAPGQTMNYSITAGGYYGYYSAKIYVDYDGDGNFNDNEEKVGEALMYNTTAFTGSFDIPVTLTAGSYRMRVISDIGTNLYGLSACYTSSGEAEDYTLVVSNCPATGPDVKVSSNNSSISAGDIPNTGVNTDFGNVEFNTSISKTYTIRNTGSSPLNIIGYGLSGTDINLFSVTGAPDAMVAPGAFTSITVQFTSPGYYYYGGVKTVTLHINSDDCDEGNFAFGLKATSICPINGPDIKLFGNNTAIPANAQNPTVADSTSFGNASTGTVIKRTYTIRNTGNSALTINSAYMSGYSSDQFSLDTPPASSIAPGDSSKFVVAFAPVNAGRIIENVVLNSNDCDESNFYFEIAGNGDACPTSGPEINLTDSYLNFTVGDITDIVNGAPLIIGSGSTRYMDFTIQNTGAANLNISGVNFTNDPNAYLSIVTPPPGVIAPGGSAVLKIKYAPFPSPGITSYPVMHILSDDCNEGSYDLTLKITEIGYCAVGYDNAFNPENTPQGWISNVTLGTINNSSGLGGFFGYSDYSNSTTTTAGSTVNYAITGQLLSPASNPYVIAKIYIDYNGDGSFDDNSNEAVTAALILQPLNGAGTVTGSFVVPGGVTPGNYKIRIVCINPATASIPVLSPCGYYYNEEAEDYILTVTETPPCTTNTWTSAANNGNWNDPANWCSSAIPTASTDAIVPAGATPYPTINAAAAVQSVEIQAGANINVGTNTLTITGIVTGTGTLKGTGLSNLVLSGNTNSGTLYFDQSFDDTTNAFGNITVNKTGPVNNNTVTLGNKLVLWDTYTPAAGVLNAGGYLNLRSTDTKTARIAGGSSAGGYINGDVTVERYIPANAFRAWRLLSVPTKGPQTIRQAWMEGDVNPGQNQNSLPGYGTIISTGTAAQLGSGGFDATSQSTSIRNYSGSSFQKMSSVNAAIEDTMGYFLFVRGDRSALVNGTSTTATILRTKGALYQGTQLMYVNPDQYKLIGNVFASAIDFRDITRTNVPNTFYLWDAKLGKTGGYETFSGIIGYQAIVGKGSWEQDEVNTTIQSGQAFFVHGSPTGGQVTMTEACKTTGSNIKGLRPAANNSAKLHTRLYTASVANPLDGNVVVFDKMYSNDFDANDAAKFENPGENFSIAGGIKLLAVEARQPVNSNDTVFFNMSNMKQQQYSLEFTVSNIKENVTAYLEDNYSGTSTTIDLHTANKVNFVVDATAGSAAANRFRLVFKQTPEIAVDTRSSITLSPNPAEGTVVNINFKNMAKGKYEIRLFSSTGQSVLSTYAVHAGGTGMHSITLPQFIGSGSYRVQVIAKESRSKYLAQLIIHKSN